MLSVLWFNFAHYALRTWPWVLAALAVVVLYPHLAQPESGYVLLAVEHLPRAVRGLLVAGFLAAFMSTIATHLNWGSSYVVSDFYRRFVRRGAAERHYVVAARWVTLLLVAIGAWVSWELVTVRAGWEILLELGAGTGTVYLLRWYWWRINAWSEIAAMATALIVSLGIRWVTPFRGSEAAVFAEQTLVTTLATTAVWVVATFLTEPEPTETLVRFYRRVRPDPIGWRAVARLAPEIVPETTLGRDLIHWLAGCTMVYTAMFGIGQACLLQWRIAAVLLVASVAFGALVFHGLDRDVPSGSRLYEEHN
jgi:Na+/proline symporter